DGVINGANAHDPVPGLEVAPRIPGKRGNTVPEPDAVPLEPLGNPQGARPHLRVVRGVDGAFHGTGDHRSLRIVGSCMVKNAVTKQRPILHQTKHSKFSIPRCSVVWARTAAPSL